MWPAVSKHPVSPASGLRPVVRSRANELLRRGVIRAPPPASEVPLRLT